LNAGKSEFTSESEAIQMEMKSMTEATTNHETREIPRLCAAVARIRAAYKNTLQKFAHELAKAVPRDQLTLLKRMCSAGVVGLREERRLFAEAFGDLSPELRAKLIQEQLPEIEAGNPIYPALTLFIERQLRLDIRKGKGQSMKHGIFDWAA
jgi:hypothetical protein